MIRILTITIWALCLGSGIAIVQAQQPPTSPSNRAAKIHADLREVLRSGGYEQPSNGEGWLTQTARWLSDKWDDFMAWIRRVFGFGGRMGAGSSPILPYVLVVVLILGIAYAIAFAVKNYKRPTRKSKGKLSVDTIVEPEESAAAEPDAWIAAARRHADAGDYRRAYRAVFLAILIRLDRRGAIRFERSKTNGDYLRVLRTAPDLLSFLRPLANDFDARWYGHAEATRGDFDHALAQYHAVAGTSA